MSKQSAGTASNVPVGTIIAFAGAFPVDPNWLVCDGSTKAVAQYPELFAAIGTAFGAPTSDGSTFAVPNLGGQFLRGVTGSSTQDPDAATRTAPQPTMPVPGNAGDNVGSVQQYATAQPNTAFSAAIYGLPSGWNSCESPAGATSDIAITHPDQAQNHWTPTNGGGDHETRPVNKYLWYVIKASTNDPFGNPVAVPTGSVVAYAGPDAAGDAPGFLWCNGTQYGTGQPDLYKAIGVQHGGLDATNFDVPDLRGQFVRGMGFQNSVDPDAKVRGPARPDLQHGQGASGQNCGSSQTTATGLPQNTFQTNFINCPDDGVHAWNSAGRHDAYTNWGNSITVPITQSGGDKESRPGNYAVDWLIKAVPSADVPVGTVVAYGGTTPLSSSTWRPCHGDIVATNDPVYPSILAAIGTTYGSSPVGINLPDYRGWFLRGRDAGAGVDPDGGSRAVGSTEGYATGRPANPFTAAPTNLPGQGLQVFSSGPHDPSSWPDGDSSTISTCTKGGDKETRPVNAYVEFIIRVA
jgi:microcystin-dependent protein